MECILENITVHCEVFGAGRPLIILPGWGGNTRESAFTMEPFLQPRPGWKRIYIDPPGHGKTPGQDWITNQDKILEVVLACIDRLTAGQRFSLAGISLGGYLARGVVLRRGELIDGIAMLVPVIFAEDQRRSVPAHTVLVEDPAVAAELTSAEAEFFAISVIHSRAWLEILRAFPQVPESENGDPAFQARIRDNPRNYAFSFDVDDLPQPFPGPTLIITGRQDSIAGYQDAWNILDTYPRASYVVLDRAGHMLEQTDALLHGLINNWLDRMETGAGPG